MKKTSVPLFLFCFIPLILIGQETYPDTLNITIKTIEIFVNSEKIGGYTPQKGYVEIISLDDQISLFKVGEYEPLIEDFMVFEFVSFVRGGKKGVLDVFSRFYFTSKLYGVEGLKEIALTDDRMIMSSKDGFAYVLNLTK